MEYSYNISELCKIFFQNLKTHPRIGHLFDNINDVCFMGMMQEMFHSIYKSIPIKHCLVEKHKELFLTNQDYLDWLNCFDASCQIANIQDQMFIINMHKVVGKMKQSIKIDNQFDKVLEMAKGTQLEPEIRLLQSLLQ